MTNDELDYVERLSRAKGDVAPHVPALTQAVRERDAEIVRLRDLVQQAYVEGVSGSVDAVDWPEYDWEPEWLDSYARKALDGAA